MEKKVKVIYQYYIDDSLVEVFRTEVTEDEIEYSIIREPVPEYHHFDGGEVVDIVIKAAAAIILKEAYEGLKKKIVSLFKSTKEAKQEETTVISLEIEENKKRVSFNIRTDMPAKEVEGLLDKVNDFYKTASTNNWHAEADITYIKDGVKEIVFNPDETHENWKASSKSEARKRFNNMLDQLNNDDMRN